MANMQKGSEIIEEEFGKYVEKRRLNVTLEGPLSFRRYSAYLLNRI